MNHSLHDFHKALNAINPLTAEAMSAIDQLAAHRTVKAGAHLLRAGERAVRVIFLNRGLLREYYIDATGNETTRRFCQAGQFSGSLSDLLSSAPAISSIDVLEAADIIELDWKVVDSLAEQVPSVMKLMRRFAEILYVRKMRREFEMLTLSAAERYRNFAAESPDLDERLPRHLIASYLGITAVHLSRLSAAERRLRLPAKKTGRTRTSPSPKASRSTRA